MPLDILGCTRTTILIATSNVESSFGMQPWSERIGKSYQRLMWQGSRFVNPRERGIPSKHDSSCRIGFVPAFCTHRPSLVPTEGHNELDGLSGFILAEVHQILSFVGTRSRNKVFVGEPAEGSFIRLHQPGNLRIVMQPLTLSEGQHWNLRPMLRLDW